MEDTLTYSPVATQAAKLLQKRRTARISLVEWAKLCGFEPAKHHRLILSVLERIERGEQLKVMIMLPPGAAKSTYTTLLFPPHYMGCCPGSTVLGCSYSYTLIESFSRKARNLIELRQKELGYTLRSDSRSAGEWETTNGCRFFCAGVNAGIAGHRADLGLIDDPIGSDEDAYSELYREKLWEWYLNDFWPRLKPSASQILICNRRHEEDLAGRLLASEGNEWLVIQIPFFAGTNDILGRLPGERLWPEWFTEAMADKIRVHPNRAGLYDQQPHAEDGEFFKRDWIEPYLYNTADLPKDLNIYAASDHAISQKEGSDLTCLLPGGLDTNDILWILPDIFWSQAPSDEAIEAMLGMMKRHHPKTWWAESGHITKSIGPFLFKRMREERLYTYVEEKTPAKDKQTRAHSIRGRMKMGMVRWPREASWFPKALAEMLAFPLGKHDDFVDALAWLGLGLDSMIKAPSAPVIITPSRSQRTLSWLKKTDFRQSFRNRIALMDN